MSRTNQNTECRDGHIVVHRFHASDYVCVTIETAELWIRHGMGEITGDSKSSNQNNGQSVTPLTRCDDGFVVVYSYDTEKYSCISEDTANTWIEQKIAKFPDPEEYILDSIEQKEYDLEIEEINYDIRNIIEAFDDAKIDLKREYDIKYDDLLSESKQAEKDAVSKYNESSELSKDSLAKTINSIREEYESDKKKLLLDKVVDAKELEKKYERKIMKYVDDYADHPYIEVVPNFGSILYEAVAR
ncbi:MAG: hypothetical protein ACRBB5_08200 [Nitrosopumilus sp.]